MMNIKSLLMMAILLTAFSTQAYDLDTHFYGTYSMARFAGIRHEVALKIATGTQWMDESYISDPLSMILLPDVGIKKRRLLHFPGSRLANKLTVNQLPSFLDPSSGIPLELFTETEADHEFATELFTEGLMEGNLMKAAVGLHTLEDSFAHAGTISELGHTHFWHHPDRPYINEASVEKYFKMTHSVFKALVAIRTLLPMNAIDTSAYFSQVPNYQLNGEQLADIYEQIPLVKQTVSNKILNNSKYVRFALDNVFQRAEKAKYIKSGYQAYLDQFSSGQDTYQAAEKVIKALPEKMVDISSVLKDSGHSVNLTSDYILSMGGITKITSEVINNLLSGIVPRPLDEYHRFEKEEEGPLWIKELDLRVANMRSLIFTLYKKDIYFVHNNTRNNSGFIKEISKQPEAATVLPQPAVGIQYATYSLDEKAEFDKMIFSFLFPKLSVNLENDLPRLTELLVTASDLLRKDVSFENKLGDVYSYVTDKLTFSKNKLSLIEMIKLAREDIYTAHIVPHENNRYYSVPSLLEKQAASGNFKSLLKNNELQKILSP